MVLQVQVLRCRYRRRACITLIVVLGVAGAPWPTKETGTIAPAREQAANALVGDSKEVLLWVRVCRDEMEPPCFGGREHAVAGDEMTSELRWGRGMLLA
jgi:hypothetical protein